MSIARRLRLGRMVYLLWHKPRAAFARSRRAGGPWQQWIDRKARHAMIAAARTLPSRGEPHPSAPEICFLTGKNFWYQTAFCCWSLCQSSGQEFSPVFIDDGTFDEALTRESRRIFPSSRVL